MANVYSKSSKILILGMGFIVFLEFFFCSTISSNVYLQLFGLNIITLKTLGTFSYVPFPLRKAELLRPINCYSISMLQIVRLQNSVYT